MNNQINLHEITCLNTVRHIEQADEAGEVFLVGTSHSSPYSRDLLSKVIANTDPDIIGVELCKDRFTGTQKNLSKPSISKQAVIYTGHIIRRLRDFATFTKIEPDGIEVDRAAEIAAEKKIPLALIDAPESETLQNFIDNASHRELFKRFSGASNFKVDVDVQSNGEISQTEIEQHINELGESSAWKETFVENRNEILALNIKRLREKESFDSIVAQVGAAHLDEVERQVREREGDTFDKETVVNVVDFDKPTEITVKDTGDKEE